MTTNNRRSALRELTVLPDTSPGIHNVSFELPPTPVSPDEEVIKFRGRRKSPQNVHLTPPRTPSKSPKKARSPQKGNTPGRNFQTPLRTSPRKRLNLLESWFDGHGTQRTMRKAAGAPVEKRARKQKPQNLGAAINSLSKDQLVALLNELITLFPVVEEAIHEKLPTPDLGPLDQKLNYLQRNIYKSFPNTRWGSNRDAFCYRRVQTHLDAFKKECVEQGRLLVANQQWQVAVEYVHMAWKYVLSLPDWDNPGHNKIKNQCFKSLASNCMTVLKKGNLEHDEAEDLYEKLKPMCEDNECMSPCMEYVEHQLHLLH